MDASASIEAPRTAANVKLPWYPWVGKKPYYGWVIVIAGALTQFCQGMISQGFATYLTPIQNEFGWSKAVLAGPRSITQVNSAILGPIQGYLVDRLGPRWNIAVGTFVMGLGCILFGLTNSILIYYVSNIIIAIGSSLQGLLVVSVALNHWFRRKRSTAMAVMLLGFSVAGVVGVPLLVLVQTSYGWRSSAIFNGLLIWAIGLPCSFLFCRSPEAYGLLPDGATAEELARPAEVKSAAEYDFSLREAFRLRSFWLLAFGMAIGNIGTGAVSVHLFLFLEHGVGLSRAGSTLIWAIASIMNMPARLIGGFLGDRLPKNFVLGASSAMLSLSVLVLGLANSFSSAVAFAVIYGIGWGVRTPVNNAIQAEYFGRKSLGTITGWLSTVRVPLTIAAPVIVGYMADVQGTYRVAFVAVAIVGLVGSSLMFLASKPKPPIALASDFAGQ